MRGNACFKSAEVRTFLLLLLLCVPFAKDGSLYADDGNPAPTELTRVDLFAQQGWRQRPVAVDGFVLGMSRSEAVQLAAMRGLVLRSSLPPPEPRISCRRSACDVCEVRGNCIGINFHFDGADRVSQIAVSFSGDMDPEVKKSNITEKFQGFTYKLLRRYSEELRSQIFGAVKGIEKPDLTGSSITHIEYAYPDVGVTVRITTDKRDHPQKAFDVEVDFAKPAQKNAAP